MKKEITFWDDLATSQQTENEIQTLFESFGFNVTTTQDKGHFPGYDLTVNHKSTQTLIEVKHDLKSSKTGNVAVELFKELDNQVLPSGLTATKADYLIYKLGADNSNYYAYTPDQLFSLIDNRKYKRFREGIGQGNRTTIALFDINVFKSNSTKINKTQFPSIFKD